jgi:hypothetical protein
MGSLSVAGSGTGQQNNVIDVSKLKRGGGVFRLGVQCNGQGRHRSLDWHGTVGKGRGGEGELGGLKKKGRHIGSRWVVLSSLTGVQLNEGNESRRK